MGKPPSVSNPSSRRSSETPKEDIEKLPHALAENDAPPGTLSSGALVKLDRDLIGPIVDSLKEEFDPDWGGFGNPNRNFRGPKFPMPPRLEFLLHVGQRTEDKKVLDMVTFTLDQIAMGGIYDQVGGGFHRYSTERTWTVPHFEKMLYDNAQLVALYSKAYRATKKPLYRRIVAETLAYIEREMTSPEGAFYSSQDAETHHEEGRNYVWTPKELADALPVKGELEFIKKIYVSDDEVNFEKKYHILRWSKAPAEVAKDLKMSEAELFAKLDPLRKKLFEVRERRDKPFLNKISLTSWTGLMIAGYAEAARTFEEPKYLQSAVKAADFVLKHQVTKEGRLLRTYGAAPGQAPKAAVNGYLEDYAFLAHGLLTLHEASKDKRWLDAARKLTDTMIEFHGDKKAGGYYFTAHDHEKFFARSKDPHDGVQPCGNSLATLNLVRLTKLTGEDRYQKEAERTFKFFAAALKGYGTSMVTMAQALDMTLEAKDRPEPSHVGCVKRSAVLTHHEVRKSLPSRQARVRLTRVWQFNARRSSQLTTATGSVRSSCRCNRSDLPPTGYAACRNAAEPVPLALCRYSSCGAIVPANASSPPYLRAPGSIISSSKSLTLAKSKPLRSAAVRWMASPHRPRARTTQGPACSKPTRSTDFAHGAVFPFARRPRSGYRGRARRRASDCSRRNNPA